MSNTTPSPDFDTMLGPKKSNLPKILGFGCGGLILLGIILFYVLANKVTTTFREGSKGFEAMSKTIDSTLLSMPNNLSIDVTSATIEGALPEMKWEEKSDVLGVFTGSANNGGACKLVGLAENLISASYSGPIRSDDPETQASTVDAINFINAIDANARGWMAETFEKAFRSGSADETTVVRNHRYSISVTKSGSTYEATILVVHS
jgi:hypothetical protein